MGTTRAISVVAQTGGGRVGYPPESTTRQAIVFGTPKTKNSRRTIPLTRTIADELARWKQQQAQDKIRAGDKYTDDGFIVTNEFGHYFEQKTFKDYYDRLLKDADIGHFTFHAPRHTFATRALERGMDYKTLSSILGHYSVAFTMDTTGGGKCGYLPESTTRPANLGAHPPAAARGKRPLPFYSSRRTRSAHRAGVTRCR